MGAGGPGRVMGGHDESALASVEPLERGEAGSGMAVCLVSGGMDSCVTAAIAREQADSVAFLNV
jgi:NH3-dependent NAD+ synthetase